MIKTHKRANQKNRMRSQLNSHEFDLSVVDGKGRVYEIEPKQIDDQQKEQSKINKMKSNFINENKQNSDESKYDLFLMIQSSQPEVMKTSHSNSSNELVQNESIFNLWTSLNEKTDKSLIELRNEGNVKIDEYFSKIYGHMVGFNDEDSFYFKKDKINEENSAFQTTKNSNLYRNKKY